LPYLHSFPTRRSSDLMRRNGLLEIRQRFDPRLPGLELRRQQSVGVEIRQLHAGPIHERDRRIEPEVRRRQWPDQKLALDVTRHLDRKSTRLNSSHLGI